MDKKSVTKLRKETGLTQKQFAKLIGVSTILVSMTETGQKRVSLNYLKKLASGLKKELIIKIK